MRGRPTMHPSNARTPAPGPPRGARFAPLRVSIWVKQVEEEVVGVLMGEAFVGHLARGEFVADYHIDGDAPRRAALVEELRDDPAEGGAFRQVDVAFGTKLYHAIMLSIFGEQGDRKTND